MAYSNRICFLGNNDKTEFYRRIAEQIDARKTRISWIVINRSQRDALKEQFPDEDVLFLNLATPETRAPFNIKINDLIFADRCLKNIKSLGHQYLRAIQAPIFDFLNSDLPTLVVGELTYGHEVLIHRMTKHTLRNCQWASPFHTRIPQGKFAFFSDEAFSRESVLANNGKNSATGPDSDISYTEMNRNHIQRQNSISFYADKARSFLSMKKYDKYEPSWNRNTRLVKLLKNSTYLFNKLSYKYVPKVELESIDVCAGKTAIFPLHLEPELNIDTCGRYWENQSETILKIWRQLGPNDRLFIKEHPVAIGNRGAHWYKKLLSHPNLHLLHHAIPVDEILQKVDFVFTISGTMGLEAALNGNKVLCLAPTTYDRLENVVSPSIGDFHRTRNIEDLYDTLQKEKRIAWTRDQYLSHVDRHAFIGDPEGDLTSNRASWHLDNIQRVAHAFEHALQKLVSDSE